jgi:hypothetical protein
MPRTQGAINIGSERSKAIELIDMAAKRINIVDYIPKAPRWGLGLSQDERSD